MAAADVARAVSALYGADAAQQGEANTWLMAFAETPAAWDVSHELVLSGAAQEVQFFGANLLHTKVRREWHALGPEARQQVFGALGALVIEAVRREQASGVAGRMLVCKRLCLALGAAAARQAELCAPCASTALGLSAGEHGLAGTMGAFALLSALADEVEALSEAGGGGREARAGAADLRPFVTAVAQLIEAHVAPAASLELRRAALGCLRAWACLAADALSVRELASHHAGLLEGVLGALREEALSELAADAFCEACSLEVLSFSLEPADVHLAATIAERFLRLRPQLAAAAAQRGGSSGDDADRWATTLTRALGQFAACAARPLACASAGASAESAALQQLVLLMVECASYPLHAVSENLVDAWVSLQDVPMAQRVESMRAPLYERLLHATVTRCMWAEPPAGVGAQGDADGEDDHEEEEAAAEFEKWRHNSAAEVLTCCLAALGGAAFASALASLLPAEPPASAGAWVGAWRRVEVVAFALSAVHVELKCRLRAVEGPPSAPPTTPTGQGSPLSLGRVSAAEALALDKATIDSALAQLVATALALPPLAARCAAAAPPSVGAPSERLGAGALASQAGAHNGAPTGGAASSSGGGGARGLSAVVSWRLLPTLCGCLGLFGGWLKARPHLVEPALELLLLAAAAHAPCPGGKEALRVALETAGRAVPAGARLAPRLHLAAAEAFRAVCANCAAQLTAGQKQRADGSTLVDALVRAVRPLLEGGASIVVGEYAPLGGQDARAPLAEALGRLVAALEPADADGARRALHALVGVPAHSLQRLLARADAPANGGSGVGARGLDAEACAAMACELGLVTAAVRFCDGDAGRLSSRIAGMRPAAPAGGQQQPPLLLLSAIGELWPLLETLAQRTAADASVLDALLELLARAVLVGKAQLHAQLPQILGLAAGAFSATRASGALGLLKAAVEVHGAALEPSAGGADGAARAGGAQPPPAVREALVRALAAVTATALAPVLSAPHALMTAAELASGGGNGDSGGQRSAGLAAAEGEPQLLAEFFELGQRVLLFCPSLLLGMPAGSLPALLEATARCVTHQEHTHTRACLAFACQLVERPHAEGGARRGGGLPAAAVEAHGGRLITACLLGLLSLSPDSLVDQQCELLGALLQAWPPHACAQWLSAAFQHEAVRAAASAGGEEGAPLFLQLLAHRPPLRHGAIAREFAAMCRREGGSVGLRQFVPTA